jgi:ankyrin repeat protein
MLEGVEVVAGVVARYTEVEKSDLTGRSNLKTQLENGLIKLYAAALKYLAEARHYYSASTGKKIAKALIPSTKSTAEERLDCIYKEENDACRLISLVQAENQANRLSSIQASLMHLEENVLQAKPTILTTRRRLLERLGATYTNDNYDGALSLRRDGTANWILERDVFKAWMATGSSHSKILWIHGPPGFGKTVLAASTLQYLQTERPSSVAYFFCVSENEAKREPYSILISWNAQLIEQNDEAVKKASEIINVEEQHAITRSEQWKLFRNLCQKIKNCTFVIDGFDECTSINKTSRFHIDDARAQFLRDLIMETRKTKANILIVSRDTAEIRAEIFREVQNQDINISQYGITEKDTRPDVEAVSKYVVDFKLSKKSADIRADIAKKAAEKSEGLFLWVHLLSQKLKPGINASQLHKVVTRMPAGLEQAYERDLSHIEGLDEDERTRAFNILRWVLFAVRPLTVREMVEALILNGNVDDDDSYPEDELPDSWKISYVDEDYVNDVLRQPLGSLIELRSRGENEPLSAYTVHFVHYSVKEYLLRPNEAGVSRAQAMCFPDSKSENDRLARLCLQYLCYDVFGNHQDKVSTKKQIHIYPFLLYAARTWYRHAQTDDRISPDIVYCARKLLDPTTSNWVMWSKVFEVEEGFESTNDSSDSGSNDENDTLLEGPTTSSVTDDTINSSEENDEENDDGNRSGDNEADQILTATSPIYYACLLGLLDITKRLYSDGLDINAQGGIYGTALQAAAVKGHFTTVEFLIDSGADVSLQGGLYSYAICAAAWGGYVDIFKLLVDSGADLESKDDEGSRPVHYGTYHPVILQICLDKGVDLNVRDNIGRTPLYWAGFSGVVQSARMLVDAGVDIDAVANDGGTALFAATTNDHVEFVDFLLSRGANVDIPDTDGWTCLHKAAKYGRDDIIKMLLEHGAKVDATQRRGLTPLGLTIFSPGHSSAEIFLNYGADVNHADEDGWTPLHIAAVQGNEELVKLFLDYGADVDSESSSSATPLMSVPVSGSRAVMEILLAHGADLKKCDINGDTSLDFAIQSRENDLILLLLGHNVLNTSSAGPIADFEPHIRDQKMDLQKAIFLNDRDKVETVLKKILPSNMEMILDCALHAAAIIGSIEIAELFFGKGTSVKSVTSNQRTALHYAALGGHLEVVKALLGHDADPHARDVSQSLPLDLAIQGGIRNAPVVKYLIQQYGFGLHSSKPSTTLLEACKL